MHRAGTDGSEEICICQFAGEAGLVFWKIREFINENSQVE
jgi:hypothetical protein